MKWNPFRLARLALSFGALTRDLRRLEKVFDLNDQIVALRSPDQEARVVADFVRTPAGADALTTRRRLGRIDVEAIRALPPGSLGAAYARFLEASGIAPDAIPELRASSEIEYIVAHYYETHDLWHVVTGFGADPAGELGVQAFLLAQSRSYLPLFVITAGLLNAALFAYEEREARMEAIARGWALGRRAERLVGVDWRPHLARPLADVQRDLGLAA